MNIQYSVIHQLLLNANIYGLFILYYRTLLGSCTDSQVIGMYNIKQCFNTSIILYAKFEYLYSVLMAIYMHEAD